jgi:hypothetical protein
LNQILSNYCHFKSLWRISKFFSLIASFPHLLYFVFRTKFAIHHLSRGVFLFCALIRSWLKIIRPLLVICRICMSN